jgi:hypothetical protein
VEDVRLATNQAAEEIERGEAPVVQLPYTRSSWTLMNYLSCGDPVTVISRDNGTFIGRVDDIDLDRYQVTVELS